MSAWRKSLDALVVLDSPLAMAWCFADEKDACADAISARFPGLEAVVPSLWHIEVANAFLMGERRGRSTPGRHGQLDRLPRLAPDRRR